MFVVEFLVEIVVTVVARFVGVTMVATVRWAASGFRRAYRAGWRREFERHAGACAWVDVLGLVALLGALATVAWLGWVWTTSVPRAAP